MRGTDVHQEGLFSYLSPESRIPKHHPLRPVREMVDIALGELSGQFESMYSDTGRRSIPPEKLLRALLLQILYSIRSERMLCEQLDYNLLFRWFIGLSMDDPVWDHSTFSKNRDRLLEADIARTFFAEVYRQAQDAGLVSDEHFSVDGTLIDAWASQKSFRRKDGDDDDNPDGSGRNAGRNFHGERRSNDTHQSTTDPESKMYRKSFAHPARLCYAGHVLMEHRHGLVADAAATQATGRAERDTGIAMLSAIPGERRITVAGDKAYDTRGFTEQARALNVTPHVAQNLTRRGGSAIDSRTTRHPGYAISQRTRKRIEECFGWAKGVGPMRKTKFRGVARVDFQFVLTMAAYNLIRLRGLLEPAPT
ncbi:MAG: IS5 family transposase [Gammaproteobacteria bacterium]|nr:IS5 family transposase [Gammaproteobacteria bacterium]